MIPPSRRRPPAHAGLACLAVLLALTGGCRDASERPRRPRGSAVWVDPQSAPLTADAQRTLDGAGIGEAFLESATLTWEGGGARLDLLPRALAAVPPGMPVTLVVRTDGVPEDLDAKGTAAELVPALQDLRNRAERAQLLPVGVHLDLEFGAGAGSGAGLLHTLRRSFGDDLLLSATLDPYALGSDEAREIARAVDYVVTFLYGQAPEATDVPQAWDPQVAAGRIAALEALGTDYLVGLHVLGRADHLGPAGDRRASSTHATLRALAEDPTLRLSIDDPFAGVGRLVHTFQAQGASGAVGWRLAPGDRIRVVRTAPALLKEVVDRLEADDLQHHAGYLFYRLAGPDEELSLGPAELAASLGAVSAVPDLHWTVVLQSLESDSVVLQVELHNRSRQRTDLAATDGNYLEVRAEGGYFGNVDPGDFSRYTLWRGEQEARPGTGWREPDRVRLHARMIGAEERIGGARLDLRARPGGARLFVAGRFFLPDGSELELPLQGGALSPVMEGPSEETPRE